MTPTTPRSSLRWTLPGDNEALQQDEANANNAAEANANNLPPAEQGQAIQKMMLALMGIQFVEQQVQYILAALKNRNPNTGSPPPASKNPYSQGLTAEQIQQANTALNTWFALGTSDLWSNLQVTMAATNNLSQQQQAYLVYLAQQSWDGVTSNKIQVVQFEAQWPASAQLTLASALAAESSIPAMCGYMQTYTFNGSAPPFGAGAEVVLVAINTKWPNIGSTAVQSDTAQRPG